MGLIIGLLVLWLILVVIGFAVKTLLWLAIAGIFGAVRRRSAAR